MVALLSGTPGHFRKIDRDEILTGYRATYEKIPPIKSVMTPFPFSNENNMLLGDAHKYMQNRNIHHLPVTSGSVLVGVLREKDFLRMMIIK